MSGWRARAACAGHENLFDLAADKGRGPALHAALRFCQACPVQEDCLAEAMRAEGSLDVYRRCGVWGGTTPHQRKELADQCEHVLASSTSAPHS